MVIKTIYMILRKKALIYFDLMSIFEIYSVQNNFFFKKARHTSCTLSSHILEKFKTTYIKIYPSF